MTTYRVLTNDGRTTHVSAYNYSDAYQQAADFAGDDGIRSFDEV